MTFQSPSSPPPRSRGWLEEAVSSFLGLGELAFGKPSAISRYTLTVDGFWRVFLYATVLMPLLQALLSTSQAENANPWLLAGVIVASMGSAAAACLAVIRVHGLITAEGQGLGGTMKELGPRTLPFLVPYLWGYAIQSLLFLLLLMGGTEIAQLLKIVVFITTLVAQWRAARVGLRTGAFSSAMMVLTYFAAQVFCNLVLVSLIMALSGGMPMADGMPMTDGMPMAE